MTARASLLKPGAGTPLCARLNGPQYNVIDRADSRTAMSMRRKSKCYLRDEDDFDIGRAADVDLAGLLREAARA